MSYISPLNILDNFELDVTHLNLDEITRLRKRLLAEFNLERSVTIKLNGKEFSKDDVIKQIDILKNLDDLETHIQIYRHQEILKFCENPKKASNPLDSIKTLFAHNELNDNARYIILNAELKRLRDNLYNFKFKEPSEVVKLFKPQDKELMAAFCNLNAEYLSFLCEEIDVIDQYNFKDSNKEITKILTNAYFYNYLNKLSDELSMDRDSLAKSLINLTVRLQEKYISYVREVNQYMMDLECEEDTAALILNNSNAFKPESTGNTIWRYVIGFILYLLIRGFLSSL